MSPRRVRLTDRFIEALKPPPAGASAVDITDELTPGLALRITSSGVKSWSFRYRNVNGRTTRRGIGSYPAIRLAAARTTAAKLRQQVRDGEDVAAPTAAARQANTLSATVDRWERRQARQDKRSYGEARRVLDLHVLPALGSRQVQAIRRRDVIEVLERLRDEAGLGPQVNRVQRALSGVLAYAVDADLIDVNPLAGLKPQVAEAPRSRALSIEELATVWRAAEQVSATAGAIVRLLILTGQRREEVTGMAWSELDYDRESKTWTGGGVWSIPPARMKSKRPHVVPLSGPAREILEAQPKGAAGDYVFSAKFGKTSYAGWRRAAADLREAAGLSEPWVIHDLRRSCATGLGEILNIEESVIGRALGHSARSRMGVTARYELSQRLGQVRSAFEAWAELVLSCVHGAVGANVIALPVGARA